MKDRTVKKTANVPIETKICMGVNLADGPNNTTSLMRCDSLSCTQKYNLLLSLLLLLLYASAKFRSNQTISSRVITSYRFFNMAAMKSEICFRIEI